MHKLLIAGTFIFVAGVASAQQGVKELQTRELAQIAKEETAVKAKRQAFLKNQNNPKLRKELVIKAHGLAEMILVCQAIPSKDRYPRSLRLYREVVILDPKHKASKERISLIEGIYKSMNRPIPR